MAAMYFNDKNFNRPDCGCQEVAVLKEELLQAARLCASNLKKIG